MTADVLADDRGSVSALEETDIHVGDSRRYHLLDQEIVTPEDVHDAPD